MAATTGGGAITIGSGGAAAAPPPGAPSTFTTCGLAGGTCAGREGRNGGKGVQPCLVRALSAAPGGSSHEPRPGSSCSSTAMPRFWGGIFCTEGSHVKPPQLKQKLRLPSLPLHSCERPAGHGEAQLELGFVHQRCQKDQKGSSCASTLTSSVAASALPSQEASLQD